MAEYEIKDGVGIIPTGSTEIKDEAFKGCEELKSVIIPDSVTIIGSHAFRWCSALTEINIPDSVTEIGNCAFHGAKLTSVVISGKVEEIGEWAFRDCLELTDVVIGDHVKKIGDYAFCGCAKLTHLVIGNSVVKIGERAFSGCSSLKSVIIPESVKVIYEHAFSGCSNLTEVRLGNYEMEGWVFYDCPALKSITFHESCTKIPSTAFQQCTGLTEVIIPDSVTLIGGGAFKGCTGLTHVVIPDSVTKIGSEAFYCCTNLSDVIIPDSVTEIGSMAFMKCEKLSDVIIPNSVTKIGDRLFMGCTGLTSVIIPNSVTEIEEYSFCGCTSLENIVIPNSVTEIGRYAFKGCTSLNTITLPESVTDIAFYSSPFEDCTALKTIFVPANKYGHFKKLLPKDLHELIVRLPKPKKPKKKPDDVKVNCIKPVNGTSSFDLENNRSEEYSLIINKVLSLTEKVVSQLRAEKKNTGKFSDLVTIHDGDYEFQFNVYALGKISVNMTFYVDINRGNETIMHCEVRYIKSNLDLSRYYYNYNDKFKMWALACDMSRVKPLIQSGDTICIDNNGKAAYAKVEILSEQSSTRKLRLTKELGHTETLAYESGYPPEITTYVADESTEEYFGGKDSLEKDLRFFIDDEVVFHGDLCWYVNTHERIGYDSEVQLITPLTENDVVLNRKKEALEKLLDNCQAEFCYGDSRVEKYKKDYMILGEENIATIYKVYMDWLRMNCSTELQEGSDDFVGVAIDWRGREDLQPTFDVSGDVVVVKNDHPSAGNPISNAKEFLEATTGERNEYLMAHFSKVFPQAHIDKIVCVLNDGDEIFYDLYTDGMKSAVTVIIEDDELDIVSTLELVMKSMNSTYEEMLEKHNNNNK